MENINKSDRQLSHIETISLAMGFTIGSGIITQTGIGIAMTGKSVFLAFLVSAVLFLLSFRPLFIMSKLLPSTSAAYTYAKELVHEDAGILYTYVYFLGRVTISIFPISFAQYAGELAPALSGKTEQKILAVGLLTVFWLVNLFGIRFAAQVQKVMCIVLLGGLLLFVISGISAVNFECFFREDLFTGGATGFYSAVSLLYFAVGGSYIITDFAPKIKNSSAIIVRVICGVTMGVCLLYMLVGVVASGTLPVSEVAGKTLTSVAREIFPDRGLYTFFVVGACIGALVTTLNSSFVWYSNSLLKPCQDGYLPRSWAKCNRFGVPYILMTIFYVYGLIPVVMGLDLTILSQMAIGLTILSICIPMAGIIKLPEKHRELWEQSGYARKYPKWRRISMAVLTYLVLLTQVYALMANNPFWSNVLIAIYVGAVLLVLTGRRLLIKKDR